MASRGNQRSPSIPFSFATWRPGAQDGERTTSELVADFLLVTEALPIEQTAAIAGVSIGTLCRWQRTPGHSLGKETRKRIQRYLAKRERQRKTGAPAVAA